MADFRGNQEFVGAGGELTAAQETIVSALSSLANSASGEFVRKESGAFVNTSLSETIALAGLSDVALSSPSSGQVLSYNGSSWVNSSETGTGTVTSVSIATFAGVSGTVATATTTPVISLSLGNITPSSVVSTGVVRASADDGAALGASGTGWADLFLASGGVINFAAGNATLTHSTGLITSNVPVSLGVSNALTAGTIELGHATDTTIARSGAGAITVEGVQVILSGAALGTPSSGTLTNCTGLPLAGVLGGTLTVSINLGEGGDPATVGLVMDASMSADERYSGITVPGTAGATLAFGDLCYLDVTATEWLLADADAATSSGSVVLGICVDASTDGAATSMLLMGTVRSAAFPASITLGAPVYVDVTAGDITATQPSGVDDVIRVVGWAVTAEPNTIYFCPSADYITHT